MKCQGCTNAATLHITEARQRVAVEERHFCEKCAHTYLYASGRPARPASGTPLKVDNWTGFDIEMTIISEVHDQQVVLLRELGGDRTFPIVIGIFEASGLERTLKQFQSPRPLTHDAWAATITTLGGVVIDALIDELREHTYFAKLRVRQAERVVEIDVRPSDALYVALLKGRRDDGCRRHPG